MAFTPTEVQKVLKGVYYPADGDEIAARNNGADEGSSKRFATSTRPTADRGHGTAARQARGRRVAPPPSRRGRERQRRRGRRRSRASRQRRPAAAAHGRGPRGRERDFPDLLERAGLLLPHPFAADAERDGDLVERALGRPSPKRSAQDLALALDESAGKAAQLRAREPPLDALEPVVVGARSAGEAGGWSTVHGEQPEHVLRRQAAIADQFTRRRLATMRQRMGPLRACSIASSCKARSESTTG